MISLQNVHNALEVAKNHLRYAPKTTQEHFAVFRFFEISHYNLIKTLEKIEITLTEIKSQIQPE